MFEFLDKVVDAFHLPRNVDLLRTMAYAFATFDAMICLTKLGHAAVVANEEGSSCLLIVLSLLALWHIARIHAFIIMYEDGWNVEAIRARHAVIAVVAVDCGIALDERCCLAFEPLLLLFGERLKRGVSAKVVFQVLHIGHTAQDGKHSGF